ncbi:hypothetical protein KP509_06G070100 [Ceratopteris richardii]|uniref:G domain-containing protein n=1 Tax=Ceratopteris richardii TaxID=49495 RepID=A0A8T2UPV1_CERRI|nr:hypothetical protein KP509_06G070100 [Ceratopteris richardii]KAH7435575.1 hypothetical protein KP509_06G070100 [Ceratopteris richardii]
MRGVGSSRFLLHPLAMATSYYPCRLTKVISGVPESSHTAFRLPVVSVECLPFRKVLFSSPPVAGALSFSTIGSSAKNARTTTDSKPQEQGPKRTKGSPSSNTVQICPGCGVRMQDKNPNAAGFFKQPRRLTEEGEGSADEQTDENNNFLGMSEEELYVDDEEEEGREDRAGESEEERESLTSKGGWTWVTVDANDNALAKLDADIDEAEIEEEFIADDAWEMSLQGFTPAGPGFGSETAESLKQVGGAPLQFGKKIRDRKEHKVENDFEKLVVCARCHELRNYGKVKDPTKESLLPDFDFERTVGARLARAHAARTVVVMVVDSSDFDGSFPRRAAALLSELEEKQGEAWKNSKAGNVPRLVLVANKIDLLPKQISPTRLDSWIRRRARDGGAPSPSGTFLVSCVKNWGIKSVLEFIKKLAGPRGEVWVIGAQNAGKSSLINALSKVEEGAPLTQLTEAPLPGTTLGLVRLGGILPANAKLFDTPGLLHPHQLTVRLNREEQRLVQARKELKPRTYRVKAGDTIHVGGLVRLDVRNISASSMYITVWSSILLTCHFARTQRATETYEKHVGIKLQPPLNKERMKELGPWVETPLTVSGDTWDRSSVDIAIAGLGWFGLGIKGTADLSVWTYEGVGITTRVALVPDMARYFEKAGFTAVLKGSSSK